MLFLSQLVLKESLGCFEAFLSVGLAGFVRFVGDRMVPADFRRDVKGKLTAGREGARCGGRVDTGQ